MYHLNWNRICNGKAVGFISKGLLLMVNPFEILHFVQKPVWNHKQVCYKPTVYLLLKEHVHCPFTEMHCFGTQICTIDFGTQMYFSKGERIHWKKEGNKGRFIFVVHLQIIGVDVTDEQLLSEAKVHFLNMNLVQCTKVPADLFPFSCFSTDAKRRKTINYQIGHEVISMTIIYTNTLKSRE